MARFNVRISNVNANVYNIASVAREINSCTREIERICNSLSISYSTGWYIRNQLRQVNVNLNDKSKKISNMGQRLSYAMELYKKSETKIANEISGFSIATIGGKAVGGYVPGYVPDGTKEKNSIWTWKDTLKIIGKAGVIGNISGFVGNLIYGIADGEYDTFDKALLNGTKTAKNLCSSLKSICSLVASQDWDELVGLNAYKSKGITGVGSFFKKLADENWKKIGDVATDSKNITASKAKNFFTNAGTVLTVVTEGIENFQENDNKGRAVAETIGESAVNIVLDFGVTTLAGAGLTAAATALGVTAGAPAIAVGAVSVAAVWGINSLTKYLTKKYGAEEKGFDELVSDTILDGGKAMIDKAGSYAKEQFSHAKENLKNITNVLRNPHPAWSGAW